MFEITTKDYKIMFEYETEEELKIALEALDEIKQYNAIHRFNLSKLKLKEDLEKVKSEVKRLDKKLITVQEFQELFNLSRETQKQLRNRIKHPLPYIQLSAKSIIQYDISKVMKWFENYEKNN
ncbi:MAG: hypothetical protein NTZ60_07460 [Campylobacterales bacterium]|nr:hypothetical protein [Campylobacterales bacterium]